MKAPSARTATTARCTGRCRGELNLGKDGRGKRKRRKVSAQTKLELLDKLDDLRKELDHGVRTSHTCTVGEAVNEAVNEWLTGPMADRELETG
jgi:hypothetical protein